MTSMRFASILLAGAALIASSMPASAQTAPIRLVVPYPPGGSSDLSARIVAQKMSDVLGRQVLVDNRPGGGTVIGSEIVANSVPDGTTMLQINPSHVIAQSAMKNLSFNLTRDFAPVSLIASTPLLLVVNPSVPAQNAKELVALAKSRPGQVNYASGGVGGITHLIGEMFKRRAGIDLVHVPYKGTASTVQAVIGGDVTMSFNDLPTYLPLVRAGKLRALAVTSGARAPDAPEIPTMAEAGFPGIVGDVWFGILVPRGTPAEVIARLNAAIVAAVANPEANERLRKAGVGAMSSTPEGFAAMLAAETEKWSQLVKEVGLQL